MRKLFSILLAATLMLLATACSENDDEQTQNPSQPETDDQYSVPTSGGTVQKDDIIITFPTGTFGRDVKVGVTEATAADIAGSSARSKFYKVTLPAGNTQKEITVSIPCTGSTEGVGVVAQTPGFSRHLGAQENMVVPVDATVKDGVFTATIPVATASDDERPWFTIGLMDGADDAASRADAETRATGKYNYTVTWPGRSDDTATKILALLNNYIPQELAHLEGLGFTMPSRTIKYRVEQYDDNSWGDFIYSNWFAAWCYIRLKEQNMIGLAANMTHKDRNNQLQQTLIHESSHAVNQFAYDLRAQNLKVQVGSRGDEWAIIDEAVGSFVEKATGEKRLGENSYTYAANFMREFFPHERSMDGYTAHGYGMGLVLEYLSKKTSDKAIVKFHEYHRNSFVDLIGTPNINAAFTLREAFDLFLKEYNLTLFNDTAYYAFALDVLNGKVDSRVSYAYLTEFKQVKDATPLTYNDDIYNFGVKVRSLAFASSVVPAGSYKEIKIEQEGDANVETLVYFDSGNGLELRGSASKGKPLIIAADDYRANTKSIVLVTKKTQHEDNTKSYPSRLTISVGDPEPVLAIGEQQLGFGSDGGEKEVVVTTNVASLSISAPSWITAHFDGANNKLTVKAARNDNTQERSDSIIVRAENSIGRVTSTIKVSQDGKDEAKEREKLWEGVSFTDFSTDGSIIFTSSPSGRMDSRIPISNIMTSAAGDVITVTGSAENISSYENSSLETESITIQVSIDKKKEVMSATIVRKETTESRWQQTRHLYEYVTEVTVDSVPLSSAREYHPDPYWTDESHRPAKITSAIDARLDKKHVTACHYTKKETYWQLPANYWEEPSWEITGTLSSVSQDVEWYLGDVKHINDFVIRLLEPATAADAPQ